MFFFFKQKKAYVMRISDWSSDVCSSDLVVEDRIIFAISLLDLVERLGDQEGADAIAGHEGKAGLEEVEPPERRKLVQHHQELVLAVAVPDAFELLGQAAADLVEHQADQRLCPADVRWRDDQRERDRLRSEEHTSELQSLMRNSYAVL